MIRCAWCGDAQDYQRYHDIEWGVPVRDSQALFAKLVLEGMQAGLSWITVLRKREHMRRCFYNFDPAKLLRYGPRRIGAWMQDPGLIRNRSKLEAMIHNARCYQQIPDFTALVWDFAPRKSTHRLRTAQVPAQTPDSQALSATLKYAGFKYVGPTICYAFMQSMGLVNDHVGLCHRYDVCEQARLSALADQGGR